MDNKLIEETRAKYGFLTVLELVDGEMKWGIVQDETPKMIMFFDMTRLREESHRRAFLQYGDEWWWGRNQSIPVDRFIGPRFDQFQSILVGYPKKAIKSTIGPTISITNLYLKRIKKKRIDIVNRTIAE